MTSSSEERFFRQYEAALTVDQAQAMTDLMDLSDNDLLDLLLGRKGLKVHWQLQMYWRF